MCVMGFRVSSAISRHVGSEKLQLVPIEILRPKDESLTV